MPGGLFSALKSNAKRAMRGNWGKAIGILFLLIAVKGMFAVLQAVLDIFYGAPLDNIPADVDITQFMTTLTPYLAFMGLLYFLSWLVYPIRIGVKGWYTRLVYERETPIGAIFSFFESGRLYARSLWFSINLGIRTAFWGILIFLVPAAAAGCVSFVSEQSSLFALLTLMTVIISIIMSVVFCIVICRYFLAPYLLSIDESLTANQAIKKSIAYTKGFRMDIFLFYLSFFGWFLLSVFVLPLLYVLPYFETSTAMLARYIVEYNQRRNTLPKPEDLPDLSDAKDL